MRQIISDILKAEIEARYPQLAVFSCLYNRDPGLKVVHLGDQDHIHIILKPDNITIMSLWSLLELDYNDPRLIDAIMDML